MHPIDTPALLLDFDPVRLDVDDVAEALKKILGKLGCPGCGRLSVHIKAVEDPEWEILREVPSLRNVSPIQDRVVLAGPSLQG